MNNKPLKLLSNVTEICMWNDPKVLNPKLDYNKMIDNEGNWHGKTCPVCQQHTTPYVGNCIMWCTAKGGYYEHDKCKGKFTIVQLRKPIYGVKVIR